MEADSKDVDAAASACSGDEGWSTVAAKPRRGRGAGGGESSSWSYPLTPVRAATGFRSGYVGRKDREEYGRKVIVQGLTASTTDKMLRSAFTPCGRVEEACVVRDAAGVSRGFAFVTFAESGAADIAAREGSVRIDGKLCKTSLSRPHGDEPHRSSLGGGGGNDGNAREEVQQLLTRLEASGGARYALERSEPKIALRVIKSILSTRSEKHARGSLPEGLVHSELQKVSRVNLSKELELAVSKWVRSTGLQADWHDRVESCLLAQRPEEIEHVLTLARTAKFAAELSSKDNPASWLLAQVMKFRRAQINIDITTFCDRFGFDETIGRQLSQLSAERARRLMQGWRPSGPGKAEFCVLVTQALKETRAFHESRRQKDGTISAVASHNRIMDEWSDEEQDAEGGTDFGSCPDGGGTGGTGGESLYVYDADWNHLGEAGSAERYAIHSEGSRAGGDGATPSASAAWLHGSATGASSTGAGQKTQRARRYKPKPTHFVLCVDMSGSMDNQDCHNPEGYLITRLEAVQQTCIDFVTESAMNVEDVFSFVTFNEETVLHFSCQKAFDAVSSIEQIKLTPQKQTLYAMGMKGLDVAIKRDARKLPAHVIFLSDGDPTDPTAYLKDLHILRRRHPGDALKIYALGFGESAKVNEHEEDFQYLQQLASLGRGHFQRSGASLASLKGAFTALTSTISHTRSTERRSTTEIRGSLSLQNHSSGTTEAAETPAAIASDRPAPISEAPDEELSSDGDEAYPPHGGAAVSPSKGSNVDFELPVPSQIFKDLSNSCLWKDFTAAQTTFKYDGKEFNKKAQVRHVHLRQKPFMQGGMRLVYGMVLDSGAKALENNTNWMCAKRLFQDLDKDHGFQSHTAFCRSTAVAQYFAKEFRSVTDIKLGFLDCHLYSPVGVGESGYHFCGEEWLKGHFVKLNSNAGYVNETDYYEHSEVAQAFSHFTFDRSKGSLLVVDLQGICGETKPGEGMYFLLTDPQVHSRGQYERFGPGDHGDQGVRTFFQKHRCNDLCKKLKLKKEYDLCEPTKVIKMPGVNVCIRGMLLGDSREFYENLRSQHKVSTIILPREAHSDWLDIKVWATPKGALKAEAALLSRLNESYERAREVVRVEPRPQWSTELWLQELDKWRKDSGVAIIPYPSFWQAQGYIQELWVFSDSYHERERRDYAARLVKKGLENSASTNSTAMASRGTVETWTKYRDGNLCKNYWYREPDGLWFYEGDQKWQKFLDEKTRRCWWWNCESGTWFYEP